MNDEAGFLAAIMQAPNDTAPKRAYADWLNEVGKDGLAAWIRIGIELWERYGGPMTTADFGHEVECREMIHRQDAIAFLSWRPFRVVDQGVFESDDRSARFVFDTGEEPGAYQAEILEWSQGFIYSLSCGIQFWNDHAAAIMRFHPVRHVRLEMPQGSVLEPDCWPNTRFTILFVERSRLIDDTWSPATADVRGEIEAMGRRMAAQHGIPEGMLGGVDPAAGRDWASYNAELRSYRPRRIPERVLNAADNTTTVLNAAEPPDHVLCNCCAGKGYFDRTVTPKCQIACAWCNGTGRIKRNGDIS